MSLICPILITVLGLVGTVINVKMLLTFYKNEANCTFLQKSSSLVFCQFGLQVAILAIISIEAWSRMKYQELETLLCIMISYQMLSMFVIITLVYYSATFFMFAHEHISQRSSSKLLISAALCWELIHGIIYSSVTCNLPVEVSWILLAWNIIVLYWAEVALVLFAKPTKYSELKNSSSNTGGKESLVWRMVKGPAKSLVTLFLIYLALMAALVNIPEVCQYPGYFRVLKEDVFCLHLFSLSSVFGVVLPLAFSDLFNSSCDQGDREIKDVAII